MSAGIPLPRPTDLSRPHWDGCRAGELRYQRWLTDAAPTKVPGGRDNLTVAIGPRVHFKVGDLWLRPGISYARSLDAPFDSNHYQMAQVDIPVVF